MFVQNLLPAAHTVLIKKDGYFDYQKTLVVQENEVTKLEHVVLFKKSPAFEILPDTKQFALLTQKTPEPYTIKNNNLYANGKTTPVLKSLITWTLSGDNTRIVYPFTNGKFFFVPRNQGMCEVLQYEGGSFEYWLDRINRKPVPLWSMMSRSEKIRSVRNQWLYYFLEHRDQLLEARAAVVERAAPRHDRAMLYSYRES